MFEHFGTVFRFTFHNQVSGKGYKYTTIFLALALFLLPALLLPGKELWEIKRGDSIKPSGATAIYVVDETGAAGDLNELNLLGVENYDTLEYIPSPSVEDALDTINAGKLSALCLHITLEEDRPLLSVIVPEESGLSNSNARKFTSFLEKHRTALSSLLLKDVDIMAQSTEIMASVTSESYTVSDYLSGGEDREAQAQQKQADLVRGLSFAIPYVFIMLMYFLVMLYANGVAQSVVLEKASKLMDTMLVSVKPQSMVMGKLLAIVLAAFLQLFCWIFCGTVGLIVGTVVALIINPAPLINLFSLVGSNVGDAYATGTETVSVGTSMFAPGGFVIALLFLLAGFLLYCSLSAICGSFAQTREELNTASSTFVMVLLVSFFLVLLGGGMSAESTPVWMQLFPFTAVLVAPGCAILGSSPVWVSLLGLFLTVALSLFLVVVSGRAYHMMSLYKGNPIKVTQGLKLLLVGEKKEKAKN
ncbi:MAG: ABC transporter permease [Lachnospiraceae bacterium]|nr:ABC transporter permease [Lachnospiraceae bacterium]